MSNKKVSVGFDIGTSGVKCVAFDHCSGQTNSVYLEYPLLTPHPGYAEFDCNTIWQRILHSFILLRNKYGIEGSNIVSIGFCALCPGLIALGDDGCELGNCIIFMDARSGKQTEFINKTLPFDKSFEIVGNRIMSGATSITTIMWLKENRPDIYEKTKYFVHLPAWAGYKCTGEVRMDLSNASGTGLYDVHEQNWSRQISDTFAIDPAKLPPLAEAVDLLGGVTNAELTKDGLVRETLTDAELDEIRRLADEKYRSWDWTWARAPEFGFKNSRRFPGGTLTVSLDVSGGVIRRAHFCGDFMALIPCAPAQEALMGVRFEREAVISALSGLDMRPMLGTITAEDVASVIFEPHLKI